MKIKLVAGLIGLQMLISWSVSGRGFDLKLNLASAAGDTVLLAHYYGSSVLVDDTVYLDSNGRGFVKRDTLLPQGIYKIYRNAESHFDFLLGADQQVSITNPDFSIQNMTIEGGVESVEFLNYMKWISQQQKTKKSLEDKRTGASPEEISKIDAQLLQLNEEVTQYWRNKKEEFPGSFLGTFLMSNYYRDLRPEEFPPEFTANDSLKWVYHYNYRKNHFFEYFDLTDERMLYTPSIKPKLDTYFEKVLLQMYDSVKQPVYNLINKVEPHPGMFRYVVSYFLNSSLSSRVMGMDALFVDLARDYYLSGKATWADSATLAKIRENVIFFENTLIGKNARDFQMETLEGNPFRLYQLNAKYTILVFYEPGCSHCREFVPALYKDVYLPFRDMGLDVVAVYIMDKKPEWEEFVQKNQLHEWHNVWDEHHLSRFKITYDTRTTPQIYLLDKDKKIIAKKFTIDFLKTYMPVFLEDK